MKFYEANNELSEILQKHGFIDVSSERDKKKGKKRFKLSSRSRKKIYFDYINIIILNSIHMADSRMKMTETELKSLLLYFKLTSTDFKTIDSLGKFNFKKIELRLVSLQEELDNLIQFNIYKSKQKKIARILDIYNNINI